MFCQLEYLRHCLRERIRRVLDDLPGSLDETYTRTLEDMGGQNWRCAHRLFQCVAVASRPLHVKELAEILAFDFEEKSTPTFLADSRPEDQAYAVLSTCSSFLAVVNVDGFPVIQFAHYSVKEYLTSARLAETKDTISRFHVSITAAHTFVAKACLGVLLHLDENTTKDSLSDFPLAEYAAKHWVDHSLFENVSPKVQDGMKRMFDPSKCHFSVWVWIYDPQLSGRRSERSERSERPAEVRATPLHYAAFFGMRDIATFLIIEHSQDVNARGFDYEETPLHVSSSRGHVELVRVLVEYGADANAQDKMRDTPLHSASVWGEPAVVRALIKHGADVKAQNENNETPLHRAAVEEVAQILLDHGADPVALNTGNQTPLHFAVEDGVVRVLLERGADANAWDKERNTPLHLASGWREWGRPAAVVLALIKHGADVKAQNEDNETPLHLAAVEEVAQILLDHGADPAALNTTNQTPLHLASEGGVVRVLIEHGADANARDKARSTPLHLASSWGRPAAVARALLKHGADVKAQTQFKKTPLHRATVEEVARILLDHCADAAALDSMNRTPLHNASEGGHVGVVRVLLEHGANANARDVNNATPLHLASGSKYFGEPCLDVVPLLLQHGSDIHAQDNEGQTPFMRATAIFEEYHKTMQLLLEHGAEDHRV